MRVFYSPDDYRLYLRLLAAGLGRYGVEVWAYCLMPNHVHFIVIPHDVDSLARLFHSVHRTYAELVNRRSGWVGHLWQQRFSSFPMDEGHVFNGARYVLLNPVRAGMVEQPEEWWPSSAAAHLGLRSDPVVRLEGLQRRIASWPAYLRNPGGDAWDNIRRSSGTGRPLGDEAFIRRVETTLGRSLTPPRRGRPPLRTRAEV